MKTKYTDFLLVKEEIESQNVQSEQSETKKFDSAAFNAAYLKVSNNLNTFWINLAKSKSEGKKDETKPEVKIKPEAKPKVKPEVKPEPEVKIKPEVKLVKPASVKPENKTPDIIKVEGEIEQIKKKKGYVARFSDEDYKKLLDKKKKELMDLYTDLYKDLYIKQHPDSKIGGSQYRQFKNNATKSVEQNVQAQK
jgi:hypothetical protein